MYLDEVIMDAFGQFELSKDWLSQMLLTMHLNINVQMKVTTVQVEAELYHSNKGLNSKLKGHTITSLHSKPQAIQALADKLTCSTYYFGALNGSCYNCASQYFNSLNKMAWVVVFFSQTLTYILTMAVLRGICQNIQGHFVSGMEWVTGVWTML